MSTNEQSNELVPDAEVFVVWVRRALADLNMPASKFLLDGTPGAKNRTSYYLKNPHFLRMKTASILEAELRDEARKQGIRLLPLQNVSRDQAAS